MRISITGASGRLGRELVRVFSKENEILQYDISPLQNNGDVRALDVSDETHTSQAFTGSSLVIHSAAYTDVDGCELDPDNAYRINGIGTWNVAAACAAADIPLVYISTDFVFDGLKEEPYTEFDNPNPLSVYGKSKLFGEKAIQMLCRKFFIVRTAWLYADEGKSFPDSILNAALTAQQTGNPLTVVSDQSGSPTYCPDLAECLYNLVFNEDGSLSNIYGIYHVVNGGYCSRYEWAKIVISLAGIKVDIQPISTAEWIATHGPEAPRPKNSALRRYCLELRNKTVPRPWEDALSEFVSKWITAKR